MKDRKPIARTQSAPHRRYTKHAMKRQTSSEDLPTVDHEPGLEINQPHITSPKTVSTKRNCDEMRVVYFHKNNSSGDIWRGGFSLSSKSTSLFI